MNNKCEWKEGKFYPCDNFEPVMDNAWECYDKKVICESCREVIEKPELQDANK